MMLGHCPDTLREEAVQLEEGDVLPCASKLARPAQRRLHNSGTMKDGERLLSLLMQPYCECLLTLLGFDILRGKLSSLSSKRAMLRAPLTSWPPLVHDPSTQARSQLTPYQEHLIWEPMPYLGLIVAA